MIKNKVPKDETILKNFVKRGATGASEMDESSSIGASTAGGAFDLTTLNKQTMNIIGDDLLP